MEQLFAATNPIVMGATEAIFRSGPEAQERRKNKGRNKKGLIA
jgi:hypothetical protein